MRDLEKNYRTKELSDAELSQVSGGLNPQPLPPSHDTHALKVSAVGPRAHGNSIANKRQSPFDANARQSRA
jgi:bacteriocin-like protein